MTQTSNENTKMMVAAIVSSVSMALLAWQTYADRNCKTE